MKSQKINLVASRAWRFAPAAALLVIASACAQDDNRTDDENGMDAQDTASVSKEVESPPDSASLDPDDYLDRTHDSPRSPMTELDSVDDVTLSDEEQQQAEKAAAESESYTKKPSRPDD